MFSHAEVILRRMYRCASQTSSIYHATAMDILTTGRLSRHLHVVSTLDHPTSGKGKGPRSELSFTPWLHKFVRLLP